MIYLSPEHKKKLNDYARKLKIASTQIAREGIEMRLQGEDNLYNKGFNDGLNKAMEITRGNHGAQMKFPSGKSFADYVCEDIETYLRTKDTS
jgi:predicted DNA-binding protein